MSEVRVIRKAEEKRKFLDRINRIKRWIKRRLFLFWPEAKTKGSHPL
jgi:hypothetical protein